MNRKIAEAAGLVYSGKNSDGENEFIGTDKQWERAQNFEQGDAMNDTLEEVADKEAVKIKVKDLEVLCERCGEPTINKLIGDEFMNFCEDCQWATHGSADSYTP